MLSTDAVADAERDAWEKKNPEQRSNLWAEPQADARENVRTPEDGPIDAEKGKNPGARGKKRRKLIFWLVLWFSGLLLGWLVVGWWLWPVDWTNCRPWDLTPEDQRAYVDLVAKDMWQTSDVQAARRALYGWDEKDLSELLFAMQAEARDLETRQRLTTLAETLKLEAFEVTPIASLFTEKLIALTAFLSMSPLILAIVLVVSPALRSKTTQSNGSLGATAGVGMEEIPAVPGEPDGGPGDAGQSEDVTSVGAEDVEGEQADQNEAEAAIGHGGESEDADADEEADEDEDEWWEDENDEDTNASIGDILQSVFEEEDSELPRLEALARDLPEIEIGDLLQQGQETAKELGRINLLRDGPRQ